MEREADVVVIGAALAGLVAGAILTRHGKRVVLLDHADAVGGRGGAIERPGGWWIDFGHRDGHDVGDCQVVWHHGAEAAREAGGMQGLMEPWARAIRARGGEIALGWKPVEIVVEGGVVRGAVAVDRTNLVREVGAPAVITTYPVWENFDLLDERMFPADFVAAAHELRRHRADLVGWQAGLRRLPTIRATGRPEHHAGWNRLLWGPERVYRGGWQITSMTSRRAAPPGKHLLSLVMARFFRGGSTAGQPWSAARQQLDQAIAYLRRFYADLDDCLEWSAYQYVAAPQTMSWAWAPVRRHGLTVPTIRGLLLAGSTLEAPAAIIDLAAYAGLEAARRVLAGG